MAQVGITESIFYVAQWKIAYSGQPRHNVAAYCYR